MNSLEELECAKLQDRILGMQRLEAIFNQNGYVICQSTGERIYNLEEIVAVFIPLSTSTDQVMAVHCDYAPSFVHKCLLTIS